MENCICSGCKNLKPVFGQDGQVEDYSCGFGYPDESCEACSGNECDLTCENFIADDEQDNIVCHCSKCGKELAMTAADEAEGEVYCVDCYLSR